MTGFSFSLCTDLAGSPLWHDGPSGRALSYADLERSARSLAAGLSARGFAKGDAFAIYLPNVPEFAVAFYGARPAGDARLP